MRRESAPMPPWAKAFILPALLVSLWILGNTIGSVLVEFLIAVVLALILNPLVRLFRRLHLPRGLSVVAVFLTLVAAIAGIATLLVSPVQAQVEDIRQNLPEYTDQAQRQVQSVQQFLDRNGVAVNLQQKVSGVIDAVQERASELASNAVNYSLDLLSGLVTAIIVLVACIYMLIDAPRIARFSERVLGSDGPRFLRRTERTLSEYVKAQLLVSAIIGVTAGVVLWIYGVLGIFPQGSNYAVAFTTWVFFMEFIPYLGPILGAVPPVTLALFTSPFAGLWVLVAFIAIHQLEGHIVVPRIMGTAVGVHPLVVIFGILVGEHLYGLGGVLLAIPVVVIVKEAVMFATARMNGEPADPADGEATTPLAPTPVLGPPEPTAPA